MSGKRLAERRAGSVAERIERGLHLACGVSIAGAGGDGDSGGKSGSRFVGAIEFGEKLAALKIAGDVVGMGFEETAKMSEGRFVIAFADAFHRQAVAAEGVVGMRRHEGFEFLPA